jgi:uncharacterized protein
MKIVIADIPDEGLHIDIEEKVDLEGISLMSPVTADLELNKMGKEIVVSGEVTTEVELQCSRCLKIFKRDLELPVEVVYHPLEEIGVEGHGLRDDELDMGFYKGEELDLKELLREQLLLNIQMKPLCSEECKGLCPRCGTDLNMGQCDCEEEEVDPRLEVLRNFFEKRKE